MGGRMSWTKKDKVLFRILQEFGASDLEAQIRRSSRAFSARKTPPESVTIFGYYDTATQQFVWLNDMNRKLRRFIEEGYQPLFGDDTSWKKLFRQNVHLPLTYQNVIPYLMEIVNARYRVVRLSDQGRDVYALVTLKNVKQTFSFDDFSEAMFLYRMDDAMEKKYGAKTRTRTRTRTRTQKHH